MNQHLKSLLLIIFISNLLYFHTYQSSFHLDDFLTIVDRPLIKNLDTFFDNASGIFHNRVFLLYSFALNYDAGGLNVFGYHVVNIILHTIVSILLYFIIKEILACRSISFNRYQKKGFQDSNLIPLISALLFSIHPLQTEAITYISSRSTLAVTVFFLASFLFFIKGISIFFYSLEISKSKAKSFICFLGGILFFFIGSGFKEIIIALPGVLLVYLILFYYHKLKQLKMTLTFAGVIIFVLLVHVTGFLIHNKEIEGLGNLYQAPQYQEKGIQESAMKLNEIKRKRYPLLRLLYFFDNGPNFLTKTYNIIYSRGQNIYITGKRSYDMPVYFLSELEIVGHYYLKLLFFPFNQSVFPDFPVFESKHWKMLTGSVLIMVSLLILSLSSNWRLISFSFFWYLITIFPYVSFLPLTDLVSEHRTYLPNIGFFTAVSVGLSSQLFSKKRLIFLFFVLIIITFFSMLTLKRNFVWQNEISLWEDASSKSPRHTKTINALGLAYQRKGNTDKALSVFRQGLNIDPFNHKINNNIGIIFANKGSFDKAEEHFKLAAYSSDDYIAHINLGYIYLKKELYYQGIEEFNAALRVNPNSYLGNFHLGRSYNGLKEYQAALRFFEKSIELNPDYAEAYNSMGYAYWNQGSHEQAYKWFVRALDKNPDLPEPYNNIGNYFLLKGDKIQSELYFQQYREKLNDKK